MSFKRPVKKTFSAYDFHEMEKYLAEKHGLNIHRTAGGRTSFWLWLTATLDQFSKRSLIHIPVGYWGWYKPYPPPSPEQKPTQGEVPKAPYDVTYMHIFKALELFRIEFADDGDLVAYINW